MRQAVKNINRELMELLLSNPMFDGFNTEEILDICYKMKPFIKHAPKDTVVIAEGDIMDSAGIVFHGTISATKITGDGNAHILALHERGDVIGLDGVLSIPCTSPITFTAIEDSRVLFLGISAVFTDTLDPVTANRFMRNLSRMLADKCIRLLYKAEVLSKRSLRVRIMTYLRIQQRKQGSDTLDLKMDREQFAQYLCVNRSALSRELNGMKRDGLVKLHNDNTITIKPPDF